MGKVWLWSVHESASIGCGDQREQRQYEVRDHVVEVEERDAYALRDTIEVDSRFGRFQVPVQIYRAATEAEINAHAAKHPKVAKRRKAEAKAAHRQRQAILEAQLASLQEERDNLKASLGDDEEDSGDESGDNEEESGDSQPPEDKNTVGGAVKKTGRKKVAV